jgi:2-desacetyl-2-hydroxyethyl bacteriochlorophyllide A dehydrogenase
MSEVTAVIVDKDPRGISVDKWEVPDPGSGDAVVETHAVGICASDIELIDGHLDSWMDITYPVVCGHEWSGDVAEVGPGVGNVAPGDRVTGCADLGGGRWFGMTYPGAAAERFIVPAELLHRLPDPMTYAQGALIEPFACALQGLKVIGGTDPSDTVIIVGGGPIGQCALAAAHAMGAYTIMSEPKSERREFAKQMGADAVLDPAAADDLSDAARELTDGRGADLVIEASGVPPGLASTFELVGQNGRILFLGLCPEPSILAGIKYIQEKNLSIRGSTGAPPEIWAPALRFVVQSTLDLSPLVTTRYTLQEAAEAYEAARSSSKDIKIHIEPA